MKKLFITSLFISLISSCLSQNFDFNEKIKYGSIPEDSLNGTYRKASYDTSTFGTYLSGRYLSGIYLDLYKDSTFARIFFCDICPEYKRTGYFYTSSDTLFLVDTSVFAEKDTSRGRDEYSYWYHPLDEKLRTDTLFIWRVGRHTLIDFEKQNEIDAYWIKFVLTYLDEYIKMDFLPYRKLE
jgi:hypothetical protein